MATQAALGAAFLDEAFFRKVKRSPLIAAVNQKDFPASAVIPPGIEAQHANLFVLNLFALAFEAVVAAVLRQRAQLMSLAA